MSDATMSQTDSSESLSESNMTANDSKVLGRGSDAHVTHGEISVLSSWGTPLFNVATHTGIFTGLALSQYFKR